MSREPSPRHNPRQIRQSAHGCFHASWIGVATHLKLDGNLIAREWNRLTWRNVTFGVNRYPERRRYLDLQSCHTAFARYGMRYRVNTSSTMAPIQAHGLAPTPQMLAQLLAQESASELVNTRHGFYGEPVSRANLYRIGCSGGHAMQVEYGNGAEFMHHFCKRLLVGATLERIPIGIASIVTARDDCARPGQFGHDERHGN